MKVITEKTDYQKNVKFEEATILSDLVFTATVWLFERYLCNFYHLNIRLLL